MKLKYLLKKTINIRNSYLLVIVIAMILIVGGCFSYAVFTARSEAKGALNIVTGNLYSLIDSTDLTSDKKITVQPGETKIITLNLTNVNGIDAKINLYYSSTSDKVEIGYLSSGDAAPTTSGYVLGKNGSTNDTKKIYVRITNNDTVESTIKFESNAGLDNASLSFPSDKKSLSLIEGKIENSNILIAYTYDEENNATKCITGEEKTCVETKCYENKDADSCPTGTVIKYAVNDTEDKFFYVLHDDGENMTLQQRENTIRNILWYADSADNSKGPLTILPLLEDATKGWTNVEDQTYEMGITNFNNTNSFTGCAAIGLNSSCETNKYTLAERTAKARMITIQEASATGCKVWQSNGSANGTCPDFMCNYLYKVSSNGGGSVDDDTQNEAGIYNYAYWTMSIDAYNTTKAWNIDDTGSASTDDTTSTSDGARAVVVIKKGLK